MNTNRLIQRVQAINSFLLRYPLSVFLIVLVLLFIKETKQFVYPQFWAEDGAMFFAQAVMYHWSTMFMPASGYLHTFMRLVANIAVYFPYKMIPAIFAYTCVALVLFVVSRILSPRFPIPYKAFFAIMVVLVPNFGELFMWLAGAHFLLLIVLILYVFYLPPVTLGQKLTDALLLLLIGLTGPGVFFLYPLFVWRFFQDRKTALWLIVLSIACAIQLIVTHVIFPDPVQTAMVATFDHHWFSTFGGRFFADIFYYGWLHHAHLGVLLSVIAFVFPFLVGFKLVPLQYRKEATYFCYIWLVFVLALLVRVGGYAIGPEDLSGDRYVYIPILMLAWLLILALNNQGKKFVIALVFLVLMIVQSALMFPDAMKNSDRTVDFHWAYWSQQIKPGVPITIPINPVMFNGVHWNIQLYQ